MSTQWNSNHGNLNLGYESYRPYVARPMILACRACDEIFTNPQSLIEHFETHENDAQRNQNHFPPPNLSSFRERNLTNNPLNPNNNTFQPRFPPPSNFQSHQRFHPYYPNGFRMQHHDRIAAPQRSPVLVPRQTQNLVQSRHPVMNNSSLGAPLPCPNSMSGRIGTGSSPFVLRQRSSPTKREPPPQGVTIPKIQEQKGYDESADKRTIWYLGQLEKPIPKVIDLEKVHQTPEWWKVNLTFKL
ncbi:unnamed protein product [Amaranthus hypochondriacus]